MCVMSCTNKLETETMKRHEVKNGQGKGNTPSATACCRDMLHYICRVLCTVNSTHGICTDACSPSCIRSYRMFVQVRSMQWTPLVVQSKRVSTRIRFDPPPKCRTRQDEDLGSRASHMLQQCWWDVLHCPITLCEQLFPCLVYSTGRTHSAVHDNDEPFYLIWGLRAHVYRLHRSIEEGICYAWTRTPR